MTDNPKELPAKAEREVRVFAVAMLKLASFFKKKRDEKPRKFGDYRIILAQRGDKVAIGYGYEGRLLDYTDEYEGLIKAIYEGLPSDEEP